MPYSPDTFRVPIRKRRRLQGNNLKVAGVSASFRGVSDWIPYPWKQEGAKSFEKQRDTKGLRGIRVLGAPYSAFRSDHTETRKT
jgi:hypothetical protein